MEVKEVKERLEGLKQGLTKIHLEYDTAIKTQRGAIEECEFWINRLEEEIPVIEEETLIQD
jgi:predicted RNase H-like nuclease (RuvC/YqgF family)